jgi:signal transduction histidine kinase/ActR/RegA family two-component response regulator
VGAPADALRSASGRLARGDLGTPVELGVENELGAVAADLETMRRRLAGRMEALERLRHLSAQVVGATSLQRLAEVALDGLRPEVGATRAILGVVRGDGQLKLRALAGFPGDGVAEEIVKADADIREVLPMTALRTGQVVGLADLDLLARSEPLRGLVARMGVRSLALVPLSSRGSFLGLLALCWTERHPLDREQEALLGLAGNQIAGALEAALRLEEAERAAGEAKAVFYAIADGVLLTDPFGRVTAMNRALEALTGWTEAEARGRPYADVLPVTGEQLLTRYGRKVPVAVSSAPILDQPGRVVGGVDVIRDVSREREIDEVKSALISTVSHELRTPLTLIHGFAELLVLRDMPVERQRSAADEILEASRRLARLIDDLLSVSRMESGRLVLDPRPLDLAGVVERMLSPFRAMAARHILRATLPAALPVVWGDPDKVEQILTNLVGNAIKYSPEGGEVLVAIELDEDCVKVSVREQGIGMSPREMAQVFEKFLPGRPRGGPPRRRHRPRPVHHQAAGRDARRPHLGGVLARGGVGVRLHPADLLRAGRERRPVKLLIADDEPAVRALVHVTLEGDDYEILEAADGLEALEVARGESPRLVLLDIMMPRLDGLEVCRQLKSDPQTSDIVVVMLTAQAQDRDQGLAAGADDYFTKPFSPLALLNMVERVRQTQSRAG